ncbi:MAG: hypothetical protein V7751_13030 [Pseudoalteromonas distincta]
MSPKKSPYTGMLSSANDHYHGVRSINENGAIDHARKLAQIYLREGKATSSQEAVSLANREVQRLEENSRGEQINRQARIELETERQPELDPSGALFV